MVSSWDTRTTVREAAASELLAEAPVGLLAMDARGNVVYENSALEQLWGQSPRDAPSGLPTVDAYRADGQRLKPKDWPIRRSLETLQPVDPTLIELELSDRGPTSVEVSSRPVIRSGRLAGAVMVVRDVTAERDRTTLREAFVGVLSHELRTPITSIYSGIELLRAHTLESDVADDVLRDVAVEAESLHRLVEDLLAIVRLERGATERHLEPVLVQRLIGLAVEEERRRWPTRSFVVHPAQDLPAVDADDAALRQVIRNLLSNAAKYGRSRIDVSVEFDAERRTIDVRITDDGPGVRPEHRDRVFDLLYREGPSTTIPGAGIGLYVARELGRGMGGSVRAEPRDDGAEFVLSLPVDGAREDRSALSVARR